MHIVIASLLTAVMLPILCSFISGYFRYQQFGKAFDNKTPRLQAAKMEGAGQRAIAAQQNSWEALAMYSAALLGVHMSGLALDSIATLCMVFVVARVVYVVCYLANQDSLRSLSFLVSFGTCIGLFYQALTF
jgi:uncharacterized MAPEG superfamily protein